MLGSTALLSKVYMCVCVQVICALAPVCVRVCNDAQLRAHVCVCMRVCVYACLCVGAHARLRARRAPHEHPMRRCLSAYGSSVY